VLATDIAQGGFTTAVFESGLVRGAIKPDNPVVGWEYTTDYTPLIPRGIAITTGVAHPNSAKLFLNYLFSNAGQQAACDAGFEAYSNTFTTTDGCKNTLKDLYAAVGNQERRAGADQPEGRRRPAVLCGALEPGVQEPLGRRRTRE
jgi:ABC-type Fe3+ transport system substrate-binding protein